MLNGFLFYAQLVLMALFWVSQFYELATSDEGTSVTWILLWEVFAFVNLLLATSARRNDPSKENGRLVLVYRLWMFVGLSWLGVMFHRGTLSWNWFNTLDVVIAVFGTVATFVAAIYFGWHEVGKLSVGSILRDPWARACLALAYKSVPQAVLALQILMGFKSRVAVLALMVGHVTILIRFGQAWLAHKRSPDRNLKAIMVSESGNELSWLLVTIVWLYVQEG